MGKQRRQLTYLAALAAASLLGGPATAGDVAGKPAGATVELNSIRGGWTRSGTTDHSDDRRVAYPVPPIDRGAQTGRTMIEGRLQALGANRHPGTLVVNGNAMPLYTDAEGRFSRPYAFGAGSNSVEVRSPDGKSRKRVQFFETNADRPQARIRAILTWDDPQAEVDLHVLTPDGQHAFFAQPVLSGGGGLDVDSVDGAGPEIFSTTSPVPGAYHLYVNYWGNYGASGYHFDESTRQREVITVRLTLVQFENTPREKRETYVVPLRKIGDLTLVRSFVFADRR